MIKKRQTKGLILIVLTFVVLFFVIVFMKEMPLGGKIIGSCFSLGMAIAFTSDYIDNINT
jgi:hypothetical protein